MFELWLLKMSNTDLTVDMQPLRGSVLVLAPEPKLHLQTRYRSPSGGSSGY